MTKNEFISTVGDYAVNHYGTHRILPSLTIAQAILESAWGTSDLAVNAHNYFGMKWTEGCGCDYYEKKTGEQRKDGSYYSITAKFRSYKTMKGGLAGYYKFIGSKSWYNNLKGVTDYEEACRLIREDGWATSLTYTNNLIRIIKTYNLTDYDAKVVTVGKEAEVIKACNVYVKMNDWCKKSKRLKIGAVVDIIRDIGNGWSRTKDGFIKNSALSGDFSEYAIRKTTQEAIFRNDRVVSKSTEVITVPRGTKFTFLGKDDKWVKLKYKGEIYYVTKAKTTVK